MKKTLILAAFVAALLLTSPLPAVRADEEKGTLVTVAGHSPGSQKWTIEGIELNEEGKQDLFYKSAPFATRQDVERAVAKLQPLSRRALRRADSAMVTANEALKKAVAAEEKIEKVTKATEMVGDFVARVNNKAVAATNIAWTALVLAIVALVAVFILGLLAKRRPALTTTGPAAEVEGPPSG